MTALHKNNVSMTVSGTPGTGTITLGSASSGSQSFATAYGADATVDVRITDGTAWEVARNCTYTHSGTTLDRGTLEASSTGSAISLTSAAVVSVVMTAEKGNRVESALQAVTPGGRLTLESGVPVSTTDQTAKTSVYYTPYVHNIINLWNGSSWVPTEFTEKTLALGTLTSGKPYDVFGYLSSGALVLESLVWTSDTARATAVTLQDGRYCKSGDKTRLLLGTFYTTGTTTTELSLAKMLLVNVYNKVCIVGLSAQGDSHTYNSATQREWNNGSGVLPRVQFLCALPTHALVTGDYFLVNSTQAVNNQLQLAIDGTVIPGAFAQSYTAVTTAKGHTNHASGSVRLSAGFHYLTLLEAELATTTTTFQSGYSKIEMDL